MKIFYRLLSICVYAFTLSLVSCTYKPADIYPDEARISFYNASQLLRKEVAAKNSALASQPAIILFNTPVPVKPDTLPALQMSNYAYFALSTGGQQIYPIPYSTGTSAIPWISYMRTGTGNQAISFLKTDTTLLVNTAASLSKNQEYTLFLADSMGEYRAILANDTHANYEKGFTLRMVHAASDTGKLKLKVNNEWLDGSWGFGEVSPFFDLPIADSLDNMIVHINLSPEADTSIVINRLIIRCGRREVYTIIPNGYLTDGFVNDYQADFRLSAIRNK